MNDWHVGGLGTHCAVKCFNYKDLAFCTIARYFSPRQFADCVSQAVQPTRPDAAADDSDNDVPVTPEVERIIRERLETFDVSGSSLGAGRP